MGEKNFFSRFTQKTPDKATGSSSLEEENKRLRRAVSELSILNDVALAVGTAADPQDMVEKLVSQLLRAVSAEQATVTLFDRTFENTARTQIRVMASSTELPQYHMNQAFVGWMQLYKKPLVIDDPKSDSRFKGIDWDETVRSVMCVPLLVKSEMTGALTVYNKKGGGVFTDEDQRLLPIIAMQSAQIMDNTRLIKENAGMQEQVKLAYDIQRNLLPKNPPEIPGYDIAGTSLPALTVGGDYFDFIPTASGDWAICLGDVSGKGLPASLLMANLQATLRGQTLVDAEVRERIERSNKLMYRSTDVEKFATLFYEVLKFHTHEITFVNAGHEPALMFTSDGKISRLETGGLALGVIDDFPYAQETVAMAPGNVMVIYSDGVTDATNSSDEPYGVERLEAVARKHLGEPASIIVDRIVEAVRAHAKGAAQLDDITVVVVKRVK
jgi:sigma-B regulation protein RsbU (phosphoserine phosphatase)